MNIRKSALLAGALGALVALFAAMPAKGQAPDSAKAMPRSFRMSDGKPNLTGLWQTMSTANWDIQDHLGGWSVLSTPGAAVDTWMGTSNGHWEGETLVVDVTGFMDNSGLTRAGNYASDGLHVVERYTLPDANTLNYEATIEAPKVFSRACRAGVQVRGVR